MSKLRHIDWNERQGPGANVRHHLVRLMADYFILVRELLLSNPTPVELHRARLATKRIRYTLELFRPCYGPGFEDRLDALRRLQQVLGDVNDAAATQRLFGKTLSADSPYGPLVEKFLEDRAEAKAQAFRIEWTEVFDGKGQFQWWIGYLARYGRNPERT